MSPTNQASQQVDKPSFVFIEESGAGSPQSSKAKRQAIRSQAKRHAIAERSKRPREIRFINVSGSKKDQIKGEGDENEGPEQSKSLMRIPRKQTVKPDLPKKEYERVRIEHNFDVFLLSGLASVHIGKGASLQLHDKKLGEWLKAFREPSYLDFVPSQYASSTLLQSVVNCTMAEYKRALCPTSGVSESAVFRLYGKALHDLQLALNEPKRHRMPDVLLATAVLQLYELLQNPRSGRWSYHTLGLIHLIQMRDPNQFNSDFELSLLASQLGPLINECFLRQIDCFLEDPKWTGVILSIQRNNTLISDLLITQAKLPRLFRIVKDVVESDEDCAIKKEATLRELHDLREFTYKWENNLEDRRRASDAVLNLHELPCAVWALRTNLNRLSIAVDPITSDARSLEEEAQELSRKIIEWWDSTANATGERDDRLYTFPVPTAQIVVATKEDWRGAVLGLMGHVNARKQVIDKSIFDRWRMMIVTKAPTRKYTYVKRS